MKIDIEIKNLTTYIGSKKIHDDISMEVFKGEKIGIIGSNGSGKTMLLNVIAKLLKPTEGEVVINGSVNMQFQNSESDLNVKVINFIKMNLRLMGVEYCSNIKEMISIFGIDDFKEQIIKKISGGQKQRINLLLSVCNEPDILLLDEFSSGLDVAQFSKIIDYISINFKDKTLIIVSHQPEEIRDLTERIILLKKGKLIQNWKTSDVDLEYNGNFTNFLKSKID